MTEDNRDYEVGYRKPPKSTQWKPGQSGNPKGRPKKVKDFEKLLDRELSKSIRISEGGEAISLTKRELIIKRFVTDALKGDRAAMKLMLHLLKNQLSIEEFEPDAKDQQAFFEYIKLMQLETADAPSADTGEVNDA